MTEAHGAHLPHGPWWARLSARRRGNVSLVLAVLAALALEVAVVAAGFSAGDAAVGTLFAYLASYLAMTVAAFSRAPRGRITAWAQRETRGTFLQRYVYGTAPGPGGSLFFSAAALAVAVLWLPVGSGGGAGLPQPVRVVVAVALVALAWASVAVSFAVTFHADDLIDGPRALEFPHTPEPEWSDYVYFAVGVMATFGTTDVDVRSSAMRRTVTVNVLIAFVFNTVIVATLVSALSAL